MCGIVGYIGNNAAADVLLDGLKNLEYRGYDSAGMALNDNGCIDVFRASGKLCNLYDKLSEVKQKISVSRIGIGHIRWATHGGVINGAFLRTAIILSASFSCIMQKAKAPLSRLTARTTAVSKEPLCLYSSSMR